MTSEKIPGNAKLAKLMAILKEMDSVLVAYLGGVDSTFLVSVANRMLGDRALAVLATSETYPEEEYKQAVRFLKHNRIRHRVVHTEELSDPRFASNPPEHCYFCKRELFSKMKRISEELNLRFIADGTNVDDATDFRPGRKAAHESGVRSPLKEAGFTKKEIRFFSRKMGLPTWDKPAQACLASRFPYGTAIDAVFLEKIGKAEGLFHKLGIDQVRLRHHGKVARVEIQPAAFSRLLSDSVRNRIILDKKSRI